MATPISTTNTESTVINAPLNKVWELVRVVALDKLVPGIIKSVKFTEGAPLQVGATVNIEYGDGALWTVRVTEISESANYRLSYEVIGAEPATHVTSIHNTITLQRVTESDATFLSWSTVFSNDANSNTILDNHLKKLDIFKVIHKVFGGK
jgi:hypothetical protein